MEKNTQDCNKQKDGRHSYYNFSWWDLIKRGFVVKDSLKDTILQENDSEKMAQFGNILITFWWYWRK